MSTSLPHKVITDSELSFKQNSRKLLKASYDYEIEQDYRHNASCFLLFESLWGLGLPFAMIATVVPAYMMAISAPKVLIGVVVSLPIILSPLQLITSYCYEQRHRKHWLVFSYIACCVPWLFYTLTALFFPGMLSPQFHWLLFTISMVVFLGLITANGSVHLSLMMDCTPLKKRGTLFGYRMAGLALGLTLMLPLAWWVMRRWPEGQNYLVAFCIAIPIYMVASVTLFWIREHRNPETRPAHRLNHTKIKGFLPVIHLALRQLVHEPNYRVYMFFTILFFVPLMMGSFIVVYARERLNVEGSQIILFSATQIIIGSVMAVVLGKLADRTGYRLIGIIQGIILSLGFTVMTVDSVGSATSAWAVYLGFACYSSMISVGYMVMDLLAVELMPTLNTGLLVSLGKLILTPVVILIIPLSGLVIDLTKNYALVFSLGSTLALISAVGFAVLVKEPRGRKMYVVKYVPIT